MPLCLIPLLFNAFTTVFTQFVQENGQRNQDNQFRIAPQLHKLSITELTEQNYVLH